MLGVLGVDDAGLAVLAPLSARDPALLASDGFLGLHVAALSLPEAIWHASILRDGAAERPAKRAWDAEDGQTYVGDASVFLMFSWTARQMMITWLSTREHIAATSNIRTAAGVHAVDPQRPIARSTSSCPAKP